MAPRPSRRLFVVALIGRTANEMTPVAVVLLVLDRGGGLALAGVTAGCLALPGLLSGPLLGAWLDRARRPLRAIAAEQFAGAAGLAALAVLVGHVPAAATIVLAAITGALQPLSTGGMTSVLTGAADEEYLPRATSFEAASFGASSVAGPLLAALLAGIGGGALAVLAQAGLKLGAMATTLTVRRAQPAPSDEAATPTSLAAGFRHFIAAGPLAAVTVAGILAMAGRGLFTVAFPLFAVGSLGRGEDFAGLLWGTFAAGSALGALALTARTADWPSQWVAVGGAAAAGLAMLPLPLFESTAASLATLFVAGALYGPSLAATFDVRRRWTPAPFLGQVFTTAASVKSASLAAGAALSGALVAALGASETILVAVALHLLGGAIGAVLLESRRR